jgi:Pvc16 N-terminal domain
MTPPSNIAAVTVALRGLLKASLPAEVETSTLGPAQAEQFTPSSKTPARLNLALYRLATSAHQSHAGFVRAGAGTALPSAFTPLDLRYLITAYGPAAPAEKHSAERLLEAALRALNANPIMSAAQLEAALPGEAEARGSRRATIVLEELTLADFQNLFTNLRAEWRPALTILVRLGDA